MQIINLAGLYDTKWNALSIGISLETKLSIIWELFQQYIEIYDYIRNFYSSVIALKLYFNPYLNPVLPQP